MQEYCDAPLFVEDNPASASRSAKIISRNLLFDQATAKIGVDKAFFLL
jgi:hypothetical protein